MECVSLYNNVTKQNNGETGGILDKGIPKKKENQILCNSITKNTERMR